jgi:hypothetical protein
MLLETDVRITRSKDDLVGSEREPFDGNPCAPSASRFDLTSEEGYEEIGKVLRD